MANVAAEAIAAEGLLSLSKSDGESQSTNDARPGVQHHATGTSVLLWSFTVTVWGCCFAIAYRTVRALCEEVYVAQRFLSHGEATWGRYNHL
jgi:hypothetical protein